MKQRNVTLKSYPCGTVVLEVTTTELPVIAPAAVAAVVTEPQAVPVLAAA